MVTGGACCLGSVLGPTHATAAGDSPAGRVFTVVGDPTEIFLPGPLATQGSSGFNPSEVAVSRDGSWLAAGFSSDNPLVRIGPNGRLAPLLNPRGHEFAPDDIAVERDGSVLLADPEDDRVVRVSRRGSVKTVAGADSGGFDGDGHLATKTNVSPVGVDALPGGGFLIADRGALRIRAVDRRGRITSVAGDGSSGPDRPEGVPATASPVVPAAVSAFPGGGFLVADTDDVRRVDRRGRIATVRHVGRATKLAVDRDGGFLAATGGRLLKVTRGGRVTVVMRALSPKAGTRFNFGDGGTASRRATRVDSVALTHDGGLLVAGDGLIRYVAPRRPARLAVAITKLSAGLRVRWRTTRLARVRLELYRGTRRVATAAAPAAMVGEVGLGRRLPKGIYKARVTATGIDGQMASDQVGLVNGDSVPVSLGDSHDECRRFGPRRLDCRDASTETIKTGEPCRNTAYFLRTNGVVYTRTYGVDKCGTFGSAPYRQHPDWDTPLSWLPL